MKVIHDQKMIKEAYNNLKIQEIVQTPNLEFTIVQYEKDEIIFHPSTEPEYLLFLIEGKVQVYGISEEGRYYPRVLVNPGSILGDVEFFSSSGCKLFSQAFSPVKCLALSRRSYQNILYQDITFLHYLLEIYHEKIQFLTDRSFLLASAEERLLFHIKNEAKDHAIHSVNELVVKLGCSRRHLQRVLRQMCEDGVLEKTGKGNYKWRES